MREILERKPKFPKPKPLESEVVVKQNRQTYVRKFIEESHFTLYGISPYVDKIEVVKP